MVFQCFSMFFIFFIVGSPMFFNFSIFFIVFHFFRFDITTYYNQIENQSQKARLSQEQIVFIRLRQQTRTPATKAATELSGHGNST